MQRHEFVRVPLINIETPRSVLWLWVFSLGMLDGLTHCGEGPLCQTVALGGGDWMEKGKAVAVPCGSSTHGLIGRTGSIDGSA